MDIEKLYGELEKKGIMLPDERGKRARNLQKGSKTLCFVCASLVVAVSLLFLCIWSICQKG